ncbi:MAG: glycoside hydrolase family 20 zincin-like fold domain-containing protein [Capsulimonadales bacterium]|nr:glycoside hydrolase family 20 zincin-like fold domain-containing protein [Capsulimonadales bacterium]
MPFRAPARVALLLTLLFPFLLPAIAHSAPPNEMPSMTVGRFTVDWTAARGLSVMVDGVPLVRQSTFYLVKSGWTGVLFDPRRLTPTIDVSRAEANSRSVTITQENENAVCRYVLSAREEDNGHLLEVALTYRLKTDVPAEIEYAVGYLSGPVLAGATLTGNAGEVPITPREIAVAPPPARFSQEENRLCPPFTDISLATRLGVLNIACPETPFRPVIFDARSDRQEWAKEFPVFWLGIGSPSRPIRFADGEQTIRFRFSLAPPTAAPGMVAPSSGETVTRYSIRPDAVVPPVPGKPLVIPTPKRMSLDAVAAPFRLSAATRLVLDSETPGSRRAATVLRDAIRERTGWTLPIVRAVTPGKGNAILLGVAGKSPKYRSGTLAPPQKPEGYRIQLPYVVGSDEAGILWAVRTVVQLLATDDRGPYLPPVTISDWPTLAVRGVHLFHGRNALPFHERLIERVLSPFKLNTLVIQAEQVRWDHDPAVAPTWAGTPEQIRREIAFARERGLTVYPLVQSYGHMEWLFNKPKNRDFAEDPDTPYAVNFTDPSAVRYLEGFNAEADRVFAAPAFHIGLDEVTMRGRFPYRSAPRTFPELFVKAATHWHDFFARRHKPIWMWADMALHPSEVAPSFGTAPSPADAAKVRAGLPKDIVMVDWQYGAHDRFPSLRKLKEAGFKKLIAATWFNSDNIRNFAAAAAEEKILGCLQTTWCGYESSEAVLGTIERRQFTAMVLAAEYFWNGGASPAPDRLPYLAEEVFARQWRGPQTVDRRTRSGWTLNLTTLGTRPVEDVVGVGRRNRPDGWEAGTVRLSDGTVYEINERAILPYGPLAPPGDYPREVTIPTRAAPDAPARSLRLLMAASHRTEAGTEIGRLVATCTDGTTFETPLVYGRNIASWEDGLVLADTPVVMRTATPAGQTGYLRRTELTAPAGKSIATFRLVSAARESVPILFAATVLR